MPIRDTFNFEQLAKLLQTELRKSQRLHYVPDEAIELVNARQKNTLPTFKTYSIRISAADSGFVQKIPRIGNYYRNIYVVAIELYVKSGQVLADRLTSGYIGTDKGIFEFFQDVVDTIEHNTLDNQLDPYPGTSISNPVLLTPEDDTVEGLGFIWYGNQDNRK